MRRIILPLLFIPVLFSCSPSVRQGEKMPVNESKYWKMVNVSGDDTLTLKDQDAALISRFKVKNFTLSMNIYTTDQAEASLMIHTGKESGAADKGYTVAINNSVYRSGSAQKTGSLSHIRNNYIHLVDDNTWFNLTVDVRGSRIAVLINDKIISEYNEPENPFRIEGHEGMKLSDGYIRFEKKTGNGTVFIGDMTLEALPDDLTESDTNSIDEANDYLTFLNQQDFPVIDFHGHLKGGLTVEQVSAHGRLHGYNYGLAPNCGLNFPVTNDSSLRAWYNEMEPEPVFKAMQCEGREWVTLFSPDAIALYDYIFTDAMTWTDHKGRRMRLWIPEETFVDNEQQFMDMLVGKIEAVMNQEPVDIYVNPTYLPDVIAAKYNELWTPERMDRVIKALADNDVALEINSRFKIPSLEFIKRARQAGVKFTLGTNNGGNEDLGALEYSLQMIREAGITADEMYLPKPAGEKKVLSKGLPAKITG